MIVDVDPKAHLNGHIASLQSSSRDWAAAQADLLNRGVRGDIAGPLSDRCVEEETDEEPLLFLKKNNGQLLDLSRYDPSWLYGPVV